VSGRDFQEGGDFRTAAKGDGAPVAKTASRRGVQQLGRGAGNPPQSLLLVAHANFGKGANEHPGVRMAGILEDDFRRPFSES
jgi:hypothetical protein